jgi:hypothetical protein
MVADQFLEGGMLRGKSQVTRQALPYEFEFCIAPIAVEALVRSHEVLEIGTHNQISLQALGTDHFTFAAKLFRQAYVGTRKVVKELAARCPYRSASTATVPKRRQGPAIGANQYAIDQFLLANP